MMQFDPTKDASNIEKHGISLARASEMDVVDQIQSDRDGETRFRFYGLIDDKWYCLVVTHREEAVRAISLRRAHQKEIDSHVRSR